MDYLKIKVRFHNGNLVQNLNHDIYRIYILENDFKLTSYRSIVIKKIEQILTASFLKGVSRKGVTPFVNGIRGLFSKCSLKPFHSPF